MIRIPLVILLCIVLLSPCLSVASAAPDLSGYWAIQMNDGKSGWMTLRSKGPSALGRHTYYEGTIFIGNVYAYKCQPGIQCNDYKYSLYSNVPDSTQPGQGFVVFPTNGTTGSDDRMNCILETPAFITGYFQWFDGRYKFPGEINFTARRK